MNKETRQFIWNLLKLSVDIFVIILLINRLHLTTNDYGKIVYTVAIVITGLSIGYSFYKIEKSLK
jgi:hypothetical protein